MWLLYVQLLGKENRYTHVCALWSIRLNCQQMTTLETKHMLQAQVCDGFSTKNEKETSDTS